MNRAGTNDSSKYQYLRYVNVLMVNVMTEKPTYEDLVQEILELKKTEEAFKESEENFRLLFEHSTDAHVLYKGNNFIDCNQASISYAGL